MIHTVHQHSQIVSSCGTQHFMLSTTIRCMLSVLNTSLVTDTWSVICQFIHQNFIFCRNSRNRNANKMPSQFINLGMILEHSCIRSLMYLIAEQVSVADGYLPVVHSKQCILFMLQFVMYRIAVRLSCL